MTRLYFVLGQKRYTRKYRISLPFCFRTSETSDAIIKLTLNNSLRTHYYPLAVHLWQF